ncbi:hypothetical protein Ddye_014640, partial [Dipteronia dyeriana]
TILLDWPNEYLTEISGSTGTFNRDEVIGTLSFTTNRNNKYGPFGSVNDGKPFEFISKKNGAIVGFFGRQGNFIDAVGVYYKGPPSPIVAKVNSALTMDKDDIPLDVGPWGGNKGKSWNGGRFQCRIIEIDVHVRNGVIRAIQYRYEIGSPLVVSSIKHGGEVADRASTTYRIILDKDNNSPEELVGISGFYGAFDANCCEYQVGNMDHLELKLEHSSTLLCTNAKVVGFHGRSGEYLDAIGVHVQYLSSSTPEQPIIGFMDKVRFVVLYDGEWSESDEKFKYQSGKSRLILVSRETSYESLKDIIYGLVNVNSNEFSIKIKYFFNSSEVLAPFEVVNDDDVQMFLCKNSVVKM